MTVTDAGGCLPEGGRICLGGLPLACVLMLTCASFLIHHCNLLGDQKSPTQPREAFA